MSKYIKLIGIIFILMTCGCGKDKYILCTNKVDNKIQNYELYAEYKIYYDGNFVKKIEKLEKYSSNDLEVLDYFEEYKDLYYNNFKDLYGGYTYTISKDKKNVEIKTTINLDEVNIKQMIRDDILDKNYSSSNKLTKSGAIYYYEGIGAICSE